MTMHRDTSDRYEVQAVPSLAGHKRLGSYLIDAGLINQGQIDVALNDQKATGMKFGEVLATRGWVKQQTVEYFMAKIVLPERQSRKRAPASSSKTMPPDLGRRGVRHTPSQTTQSRPTTGQRRIPEHPTIRQEHPTLSQSNSGKSTGRKVPPITKPLPSTSKDQDGVNWVG